MTSQVRGGGSNCTGEGDSYASQAVRAAATPEYLGNETRLIRVTDLRTVSKRWPKLLALQDSDRALLYSRRAVDRRNSGTSPGCSVAPHVRPSAWFPEADHNAPNMLMRLLLVVVGSQTPCKPEG